MTVTVYITFTLNSGKKWCLDEVFPSMKALNDFYNLADYKKAEGNVFQRHCETEWLKIIKQKIEL